MKKHFSIRTLTILLVVAAAIAFCIALISWVTEPPYYAVFAADDAAAGDASGEDSSGDTSESTPSETPSETETELKLEKILAKLNAQTASDYFKQTILPLLTGTGSALVAGLLALLPYIKNKNRRKQLEAYAATLQKANEDLDTLLKSTDPEAIKKAVDGLFGERATEIVNEMIKQIPIDNKRVNELATEIGTVNAKLDCLIKGDNSITMLIWGILAIIMLILAGITAWSSVKSTYYTQCRVKKGEKPETFRQTLAGLLDKNFYKTALFLPIISVCVFSVLPIVFMILIAFTNYGGDIVPPKLVDWVGLANFVKLFNLSEFSSTLFKILEWNIMWAIMSTALTYFGGLGLALLYNKKCVKAKGFFRIFPVLAYALPGFITMLGFKFMFSYGGPINYYITKAGGSAVGFLDIDAGWKARLVGLFVSGWMSIPSFMLYCSGILSNMNQDIHEAAIIDGASAFKRFIYLTLPFVIFATTPILISSFIGNFNNFGVFFFLRGGLYVDGYFLASDTDLLINWLYNLSISNNYYAMGAAISLVIFLFTSTVSLIVYILSPSYRKEETYQ